MTELESSAPRTREAGYAAATQRPARPVWCPHETDDASPQVGAR
jgi:hypothetical protein